MEFQKTLLLLSFAYIFLKINSESHCDRLKGEEKEGLELKRKVFYATRENKIKIHYANNSATARAAASLLYVLARYGYYQHYDVTLEAGPADVCGLSKRYFQDLLVNETELVVDIAAVWHPENNCQESDIFCENFSSRNPGLCGIAGRRLRVLPRAGVASPRLLPLVRLAPSVAKDTDCEHANSWDFYRGPEARKKMRDCLFIFHTDNFSYDVNAAQEGNWPACNNEVCVEGQCVAIFAPSDHGLLAQRWATRLAAASLPACVLPLEPAGAPRTLLLQYLHHTYNSSFLFIDYDVWEMENVRSLTGALCGGSNCTLDNYIDSTISLRVADADRFWTSAPPLYKTLRMVEMKTNEIRQVLEAEAKLNNSIEAACAWAANNTGWLREWSPADAKDTAYYIYIFLCKDDPDWQFYNRTVDFMRKVVNQSRSHTYELRPRTVMCNDTTEIIQAIRVPLGTYIHSRVAGFAIAGAGTSAASTLAKATQGVVAVAYNAPSHRHNGGARMPSIVGDVTHLACAFRRFLSERNWRRVGVLLEQSPLADQFIKALTSDGVLVTWQESVEHEHEVEAAVARLRERGTRVWLVAAGGAVAAQALCAARGAGAVDERHAWLLSALADWPTPPCAHRELPHNLYSVSFWWRGEQLLDGGMQQQQELQELQRKLRQLSNQRPPRAMSGGGAVPPLAASLVDAVLAIARGYDALLNKYQDRRYDLPFTTIYKAWTDIFKDSEDKSYGPNEDVIRRDGIIQRIRSSKSKELFVREEPLVFVNRWTLDGGDEPSILAAWRVQSGNTAECRVVDVAVANVTVDSALPLDDGTVYCLTTSDGDHFTRHCHDSAWGGTIVALLVVVAGGAVLHVVRQNRERRRRAANKEQRLLKLQEVQGLQVVPRSRLTLCDEQLGKGHFGRVVRGVLRQAGGSRLDVAVKELTDDSPAGAERTLLREAALLGELAHRHVVQLEGVCAESDSLLLVMRRAFFGDLSSYLQERRLLDGDDAGSAGDAAGEAQYVGAAALTRLLRQAALALAHVHRARVVHRDVRAANCLVDERRALLLADFGMARRVGEDDEEYVCRQRALFPVRWMAPESVRHGVFSAASDVWALGALALEVVTLGERPFSGWPTDDILMHVRAGGEPPLPLDVTPDMRELVSMCWSRRAECRAGVARVAAWLAEHPLALAPSRSAQAPPSIVYATPARQDSGFGDATNEHLCNEYVQCSTQY